MDVAGAEDVVAHVVPAVGTSGLDAVRVDERLIPVERDGRLHLAGESIVGDAFEPQPCLQRMLPHAVQVPRVRGIEVGSRQLVARGLACSLRLSMYPFG